MGFLWDLIQQSQISDRETHAQALEERVERLETELGETRFLLHEALKCLEARLGEDLDGDSQIG
jgi:hypothetical protein